MVRHEGTVSSARAIIRLLINNHPLPFRIQREIVDQARDIFETSAGKELNRGLIAQYRGHKEEVRARQERVRACMEQARVDMERGLECSRAGMNE